jgi:hypothetical protein
MVIIQVPWRCNVAHKPDLRTANYTPEFPLICCLPSPFPSVTTTAAIFAIVITATAVYVASTTFTVIAAIVIVTAAVSSASAAVSIYSASALNRSPHSVNSVRPWSYHPRHRFRSQLQISEWRQIE